MSRTGRIIRDSEKRRVYELNHETKTGLLKIYSHTPPNGLAMKPEKHEE